MADRNAGEYVETVISFKKGIVPQNPLGLNGTWHSYEIAPSHNGNVWALRLDGELVDTSEFAPVRSTSPPAVIAEQVTTQDPRTLGPVEFRNVSYLMDGVWHPVRSLAAIVTCKAVGSESCETPFGVSSIGPNHLIAGSGITIPKNSEVLYYDVNFLASSLLSSFLIGIALLAMLAAGAGAIAVAIRRRQEKRKVGSPLNMAMFCTRCGTRISSLGRYCPNCGSAISPFRTSPGDQ